MKIWQALVFLIVIVPTAIALGYNNQNLPGLQYHNPLNFVEYYGNTAIVYGNLNVTGNFSAKRPYYNGYDNSTQNFVNTANSQIMNLSNNGDYDAWLVNITKHQNITFQQTGDYLIIVSPEFFQASGGSKIVTFWLRKNGVDVPFSNSRYSMTNNEYFAPAITWQVDITNPATDYVNIMWWSETTSTQIITITGLTNPTRPSIPGVLVNIQKVSEITS